MCSLKISLALVGLSTYAFTSHSICNGVYKRRHHNGKNSLYTVTKSYIDDHIEPGINSGLGMEQLIYCDDDIIVVDKPSFCQTAPGFREPDSLATHIARIYNIDRIDKMIVHRLDYATSGVLVFARNENSLRCLHSQFREKEKIYKRYSAIVSGINESYDGEIDLPLGKDVKRGPPLCCVDVENGKRSITKWKVHATSSFISRGQKYSFSHLHLQPLTGRTHQLRIHMSSINQPIVGDLFYAPEDIRKMSSRLLLHAEELRVLHPRTRIPMKFVANCPFSLEKNVLI